MVVMIYVFAVALVFVRHILVANTYNVDISVNYVCFEIKSEALLVGYYTF